MTAPRIPGVHIDLAEAADRVASLGGQLGTPMVVMATTTSTNDVAKRAARDGAAHGATWVAEEQTAGRGRRGHSWVSPPGEGLLFSVLLRLPCTPARVPPIALVAGLAVRDAVAAAAPGASIAIKWPNDVLVAGRKVAGILIEAITVGSRVEAVVVGIGINVHTRAFPDEISDRRDLRGARRVRGVRVVAARSRGRHPRRRAARTRSRRSRRRGSRTRPPACPSRASRRAARAAHRQRRRRRGDRVRHRRRRASARPARRRRPHAMERGRGPRRARARAER